MNIYEDISKFAKTLLSNKEFFSYIENQGSYFIVDVLNSIEDTRLVNYENYMNKQKLLHDIMLKEVIKINNDLGDKLTLLKGLQLDKAFYESDNIMRFYEDIDFICGIDDGEIIVSYFIKNGYKFVTYNLLCTINKFCISYSGSFIYC